VHDEAVDAAEAESAAARDGDAVHDGAVPAGQVHEQRER
jgi:hypothetical protein